MRHDTWKCHAHVLGCALALTGSLASTCIELKPGDVSPPGGSTSSGTGGGGSPPELAWSQRLGGAGVTVVNAVATNEAGEVFVAGTVTGDLDVGGGTLLDHGDQDIFIAAFHSDGSHKWSQRIGGGDLDWCFSLAVGEPGSLYVAGFVWPGIPAYFGKGPTTGDGQFLLKLDAETGYNLWRKNLGPVGVRVAANAAGDVVVAGFLAGTVDYGDGPMTSVDDSDLLVVEFDRDGVYQWGKRFGGPAMEGAADVAVDEAGEVLIAGSYEGALDLGCGEIGAATGEDPFIARLDASGGCLWSKGFYGFADDYFQTVAFGPSGEAVVAGTTQSLSMLLGGEELFGGGGQDIILAKFDASGNHVYSGRFGGAEDQLVSQVKVDGDGEAIFCGSFKGSMSFGAGASLTSVGDLGNVFLVTLGPSGSHVHSAGFGSVGGTLNPWGNTVSVDRQGDVLLGGTFNGTFDLGGGPLTGTGEQSSFLAKFRR
jgi:hypothetical protein